MLKTKLIIIKIIFRSDRVHHHRYGEGTCHRLLDHGKVQLSPRSRVHVEVVTDEFKNIVGRFSDEKLKMLISAEVVLLEKWSKANERLVKSAIDIVRGKNRNEMCEETKACT